MNSPQQKISTSPPEPPGWGRRITEAIMALCLAIMVLAVFVNVVLRYGFGSGIAFYEELSRLMFVWLVCIGAVLAAAEGKHLGFDMLTDRLKGLPLNLCRLVATLASAVCLVLVARGSWQQVEAGMQSFSTVIGYPLALAAAGTLVMSLGMLVVMIMRVRQHRAERHASLMDGD